MEPHTQIRIRAIFHGRVQGVFFRATAEQLSHGFNVCGFVRNRPDGTVELEAQGPKGEVEEFIASIHERYGAGIERVDRNSIELLDDQGFVIRR